MKTCDYCEGSKFPGVHLPTNFDDREDSKDGKVFVAKCDACGVYSCDGDAAAAIAEATGWDVFASYDRDDSLDPENKAQAAGQTWHRPYFAVTLAQALDLLG